MNDQPKDQRPTPETDRIARAACDDKGMLCRPQLLWDALERLERDLAEAREQLAEAREDALAHAELLTAKDRQLAAERALADYPIVMGERVTRSEIIESIREMYEEYRRLRKLEEPCFSSLPDYEMMLDWIEEHGLPTNDAAHRAARSLT